MTGGQIAAVAISVAGLLIALWLLIRRGSGRGRAAAVIGSVMILLGVLSRLVYQWMAERMMGTADDSTIVTILAAEVAVGGLLTGAGLLLVARAIVVAGWPAKINRPTAPEQGSDSGQ